MKQRKVWRYNCEFCSRGYFKPKKCQDHEKRCIQNPSRVCGMCERNDINQAPLEVLKSVVEDSGYDIDALRQASLGCPMCMLAVVMAENKAMGFSRRSEEWWYFDYAEEMKIFDAKHSLDTNWLGGSNELS